MELLSHFDSLEKQKKFCEDSLVTIVVLAIRKVVSLGGLALSDWKSVALHQMALAKFGEGESNTTRQAVLAMRLVPPPV